MRILFELGHPAHFHLFKNFIFYLKNHYHDVTIITREKDILNDVVGYYNLKSLSISKSKNNILLKLLELIRRDIILVILQLKNKYEVAFGSSESIAHISFISNLYSIHFDEDDDDVVPLSVLLGYSFFNRIINPNCLRYKKYKKKRILHNSYHELAYLHPNNFKPDVNILKKYNLENKKYIILRLNSLKAHHDVGAKGISNELYFKIKELLKNYTIIESRENAKTHQIEPWDMHHVLAYAKMIICDSQTMAAEAMVLGTPSIRINTFVGRISYLEELENIYNLGYGFLPIYENEEKILNTINYLVTDNEIETLWQSKRQIMLSEKCDLNQWMIDYFEKEIIKNCYDKQYNKKY